MVDVARGQQVGPIPSLRERVDSEWISHVGDALWLEGLASARVSGMRRTQDARFGVYVDSILGGPVSFMREAGFPFQRELIRGLEDRGFADETTPVLEAAFPELPRFPPNLRPIPGPLHGLGEQVVVVLRDGGTRRCCSALRR